MNTYKLTLAFDNFDKIIEFYRLSTKKTTQRILDTLASMGVKGLVVANPDNSLSVTWYFRYKTKYDKFVDTYLEYNKTPDCYVPGTKRINYQN